MLLIWQCVAIIFDGFHETVGLGFFPVSLFDLGPFFYNFFQFFGICNVTFEITAIRADIIVECGNGNDTYGDAVTTERAAFR